jgi:hypothetical protein
MISKYRFDKMVDELVSVTEWGSDNYVENRIRTTLKKYGVEHK